MVVSHLLASLPALLCPEKPWERMMGGCCGLVPPKLSSPRVPALWWVSGAAGGGHVSHPQLPRCQKPIIKGH